MSAMNKCQSIRRCRLCGLSITEGYEVKCFKAFYHPGCAAIVARESTTKLEITGMKEEIKGKEGEKKDASLRQDTKEKSATQRD